MLFNSFEFAIFLPIVFLLYAYKVEGVPSLGVAGRFYTDGTLAKSLDRALTIVEFLAAQIRSGH